MGDCNGISFTMGFFFIIPRFSAQFLFFLKIMLNTDLNLLPNAVMSRATFRAKVIFWQSSSRLFLHHHFASAYNPSTYNPNQKWKPQNSAARILPLSQLYYAIRSLPSRHPSPPTGWPGLLGRASHHTSHKQSSFCQRAPWCRVNNRNNFPGALIWSTYALHAPRIRIQFRPRQRLARAIITLGLALDTRTTCVAYTHHKGN